MRNAKKEEWKKAKEAICNYGKARTAFRNVQKEMHETRLLSGNDNKVGIAGEFWTKAFYHENGY